MGSKSTTTVSSGIGFTGMLTVAFIVLKLCGVIGWSWWWVLAPAWMPLVLILLILGIVVCVMAINYRRT